MLPAKHTKHTNPDIQKPVKNQAHWGHICIYMNSLTGRQTTFLDETAHGRQIDVLSIIWGGGMKNRVETGS